MRYTVVIKNLSYLTLIIGASMLLPLAFSIHYDSGDAFSLIISAAIGMVLGISGIIFTPVSSHEIRPREAFAIVTSAWIIFASIGSLPYLFSGATSDYTDAFFETMSGITTTGATIFKDIESLPEGILFWRSLTHWLGGMGIVLFSIAILPFLGVGGMQLFKAEVPGPSVDKLSPRIKESAKILWLVYVLLTAILTILLISGGMSFFDALCHSFGTMATGGFSTKNSSIAYYSDSYIDYVLIVFMLIAGTNFTLIYKLMKGDLKSLFNSGEFKIYISIVAISSAFIAYHLYSGSGNDVALDIKYALFQVSSIITTTGFINADYEQWSSSSRLILMTLMFIGGCAGSTAGGLKVIRLIILLKFMYNELKRLIHPQAIIHVKFGNFTVDNKVLANVVGFFTVYVVIAVMSTIVISSFGIDFVSSLGAVSATLNNVGPGFGDLGPTDNFSALPAVVKWILSFLMMLGRLEIYTVIILITPIFWRK